MLNYRFNCTFHLQVWSYDQDCCTLQKCCASSLKQVLKQHYRPVGRRTWIFWHKLEILVSSHLWFWLLKWLSSIQLSGLQLKLWEYVYRLSIFFLYFFEHFLQRLYQVQHSKGSNNLKLSNNILKRNHLKMQVALPPPNPLLHTLLTP